MTVYAVDNRVDDCELEKERVDSTAERFNDKETSEDPAAEAALAKADEAKSAAEDAAKTVENLQKTIDDLEVEKKVEAAGAEGTGETESTGAVKVAEDAAASAEAAAGCASCCASLAAFACSSTYLSNSVSEAPFSPFTEVSPSAVTLSAAD